MVFALRAVSSVVERLVYTEMVGGSNPSLPSFRGYFARETAKEAIWVSMAVRFFSISIR